MKKLIIISSLLLSACSMYGQRLIVRMDDIGVSHSENLAVIHCYQNGIGRSAEVMSVCPWFMEAANMLNENPGLDVGVHVAFQSEWLGYKWRPITHCPSLCDEDGFLNLNFGGKPELAEAEAELRAQIELALKYVKNVTHVTDHCMWTFLPGMQEMVVRVAKEYGLRYQGLPAEDEAIGIYTLPAGDGSATYKERLFEGIKKMEKGKTYWTIEHPAFANEEMKAIYHLDSKGKPLDVASERQAVTDAFTDPEIITYIKEHGIELVSFGDIIREHASK